MMNYTLKFVDGKKEIRSFRDSDHLAWYIGVLHMNGERVIGYIKNKNVT